MIPVAILLVGMGVLASIYYITASMSHIKSLCFNAPINDD